MDEAIERGRGPAEPATGSRPGGTARQAASGEHMRAFWDARAREDALFFVDSRRRFGEQEDGSFWEDGERDLGRILDVLGVSVRPGDDVLDIGCGVGRLTRALAKRARHVTGIDVSAEMLARARALHADLDGVDWVLGDGVSLRPLDDASFDAIISHVVFQHIPDPQVTLGYVREMGRVLRPGGWSAFQISNDPGIHRPSQSRRLALRTMLRRGRTPARSQRDPAWIGSAVDLADLRGAAADAALALERVEGAGTQLCMILARR